MGAKESRASILSYDEASKRVTSIELQRLQEAYKRSCGYAGIMREAVFVRDVLGENVPTKLSQRIFNVMSSNSRGMSFRDLLVTLVLLTRGRQEERLKLTYAVYSDERGSCVTSTSMSSMVSACEKTALPHEALSLFKMNDNVTYDLFRTWVLDYPNTTSVTRWLVNSSGVTVSLTNNTEMPNFYQTLAGVTHLEEPDITELEKQYWMLKSQSKTGRFDLTTFTSYVSPPLPQCLIEGLFNAFDENRDGHIDFKEISCGVSACCRGPFAERQKFCYKVFDTDQDGKLNSNELKAMALGLLEVQKVNAIKGSAASKKLENISEDSDAVSEIVSHILCHSNADTGEITLEEYQMWSLKDPLPISLLNIVVEICHIVLGLRPTSPTEEGVIIRGWMQRASQSELIAGETWYVASGKWWRQWKLHTEYDPVLNGKLESPVLESGYYSNGRLSGETSSTSSDTVASAHEATETMQHVLTGGEKPSKNRHTKHAGKAQRVSKTTPTTPNTSPGPINNSDILLEESKVATLTDEGGRLKEGLVEGQDFIVLPAQVWKALHHWYGGSPSLPRIVPAPNKDEKCWIELHRLNVLLLRHQMPSSMQQLSQVAFPSNAPLSSVGNTAFGMLKQSLNYVTGGSTPKRQITHRATFSKRHTVGQVAQFLSLRLRIPLDSMRLWHLLDENNATLLEDDSVKMEALSLTNNAQFLLEVRNVDMSWPEELSQIARNHKQKTKPLMPVVAGASGLSNLGNTCFMNSGLQCISNTRPLTKYFLENKHLFELNRTNPLGMKGHIAKRYCDLTQELWSGASKTVAPLKLRWTISKYAPRFNGFSQHDSQELLAFLLDGLHEDLNRVQTKPYVELKDSDGRPDEEVAQEAWENHLARNQSIIVDLFHGQIRSRVRCLHCNAFSTRFDPFTFLSLPLPMDNSMYLDVIVIRLDGEIPVRFGLRLNMDDTFVEVRKHLAEKCKISMEAVLLSEVLGATIKSFLQDNLKVRSLSIGNIYAYEIPPPVKAIVRATPNGESRTGSAGNSPNTLRGQKVNGMEFAQTIKRVGSLVHETNKQSVTNPAALHIENKNASCNLVNSAVEPKQDNTDSKSGNTDSTCSTEVIVQEPSSSSNSTFYISNKNENQNQSESGLNVDGISGTKRTSFSRRLCEAGDMQTQCAGYVVAYHRKTFHTDVYFLSSQKHRPSLFGLPLVVPCVPGRPKKDLYSAVWKLVSRLVSPLPPQEATAVNHAQDCDDSMGSQYPFLLRCVDAFGMSCGNKCPWFRFCTGCIIDCSDDPWQQTSGHISIDWDPTALHLRYQPSAEREVKDDASVEEGHRGAQQRIDLNHCLRAFTTEEELGKDELYHCGKCKTRQLAKKKLDIWRLPPTLIIHLKRFQFVNGRWIKSHKVVDFPKTDFDPSSFMTKRDEENIDIETSEVTASSITDSDPVKTSIITSKSSPDAKPSKPKPHISFEADEPHVTPGPVENGASPAPEEGKKSGLTARKRKPSFREESPPLYDLYAVSCHSGILGGGHYIAYAKNKVNNKWYCYNDSSCKEVSADNICVETAYTLFYERQGIDYDDFMPSTGEGTPMDTSSMDEDYNSEFKKYCVIQ
uniref:ubiquitin carboxyl-terminal hydrolase 32 n=1 Tax=Ciona intestinalis TaxID=7719 RepID=UPI0002B8DF87|nr:ubiquitin carboxyl-terminal hydrolase 32 [Ciona intestinalis]|eukprot:XP_018670070.1 ubiquitin carboxyl-terminal hydrolase 32 [Ciona intestinalis]